ncbi:MAG: peptidyl-prolyl cis-trans isomerase [Conexibacter sp.]
MINASRILPALGAFFVLVPALAGCGSSDSIPGNAVASIDGQSITKDDYTHWATITAKGASGGAAAVVVPDPPDFKKCIAQLRAQTKPKKGQPAPTETTLAAQCRQRNEQVVQQTLATLIQSAWIEREAEAQGVKASDKEVDKQLAQTKQQSFPKPKAYAKFLKQSGMTNADVRFRLRVQLLAQKITTKVQNSAGKVTDQQIADYYNKNKQQFALPERRDLEIILTKTEAQANEAKAAVQGGMSWAAAAKKYSTDPASKATGGVLRGVAQGQQDRALDKAAFAAAKGELVGPVKGQFGWYIVRVKGITKPEQTPLSEAKAQIKPLLTQQGQQAKLQTFATDFQKRWKEATKCRTGYIVALCSNAPKPKTTSTAGGTVATTPSTQGGGSTDGK